TNKHAEAAEYWRQYLTNDNQSEWALTGASVFKILRNANAPVGVLRAGHRQREIGRNRHRLERGATRFELVGVRVSHGPLHVNDKLGVWRPTEPFHCPARPIDESLCRDRPGKAGLDDHASATLAGGPFGRAAACCDHAAAGASTRS